MKKVNVSFSIVVPDETKEDLFVDKILEMEGENGVVMDWDVTETEAAREDLEEAVVHYVEDRIEEIISEIDAFSPDGKRCDTTARSSFEPEGWHVEEDGNKWLLVVDGYEIYSYYQGDPSRNGDWSSSRTKACCYVEISFDDQGMSYAVTNIDYPEAY